MRPLLVIAWREYLSFFRLPVGWIVIALFLLLTGAVFALGVLVPGQASTMRPFFAISGWLLLPVVPAVSMRLFSEELRTGTIEPLLTSPVRDGVIVLGKFLGAACFLLSMLLPTLVFPLTLAVVSDPRPDPGPILAGYLSLVLLGLLNLSIGTLASACTSSQTLSFLATLFILLGLLLVPMIPLAMLPMLVQELLSLVSITARLGDFAKGIIDTSHVLFFLCISAWLLTLATLALQSRRWR
ncbi:ABC transporter permease [Nodularia spumigena]|uniref:ABC transporter permease n=1 Tax=Nodularia spumigena TaxID=70799 RepID=UPI002B21368B|nr:ABC transporter permease [Nodularia spumigena]MEA5557620.1 ABC transporter permease [Nodularia spumigena CH309]